MFFFYQKKKTSPLVPHLVLLLRWRSDKLFGNVSKHKAQKHKPLQNTKEFFVITIVLQKSNHVLLLLLGFFLTFMII